MDNLPEPSEPIDAEILDPDGTKRQVRIQLGEFHSGPLPSARHLAEYEAVHPGLAERIVRMAEVEQQHRQEMDRGNQELDRIETEEPFKLARRGQDRALAAMVLVLLFAFGLAMLGAEIPGAIVAGVDIVALVTVFIRGQRPDPPAEQPPR